MLYLFYVTLLAALMAPLPAFIGLYFIALSIGHHPDVLSPALVLPVAGRITVADVVLVCVFFRAVNNARASGSISRFVCRESISVMVLFITYLFTTLISSLGMESEYMIRCLVSLSRLASSSLLFFIVALSITTERNIRTLFRSIYAFLWLNAFLLFWNVVFARYGFVIGEVQGLETGELRYFGLIGDTVGFVLALGTAMFVARSSYLYAFIFAVGVVFTGTFGALIVTLVSIATIIVYRLARGDPMTHKKSSKHLVAACGAIILAFIADRYVNYSQSVLQRVNQSNSVSVSVSQRLFSFGLAMELFQSSPLYGVGYQGFFYRYGFSAVTEQEKGGGGDVANANNQLLQVAADGGIILLSAFIGVIVLFIQAALQALKRLQRGVLRATFLGLTAWFIGILLGNQSAVWFIPASFLTYLTWTLFGLTVAIKANNARP